MEGVSSIVTQILAVFTAFLEWFVDSIGIAMSIFYVAETGLTVIGTITVIGLALAVTLLVAAWIRSLMKNRG